MSPPPPDEEDDHYDIVKQEANEAMEDVIASGVGDLPLEYEAVLAATMGTPSRSRSWRRPMPMRTKCSRPPGGHCAHWNGGVALVLSSTSTTTTGACAAPCGVRGAGGAARPALRPAGVDMTNHTEW
jgi:hypothetical protein